MTSSSGPGYASYIDTATDLAGQSWAVWAENGLLYSARWDELGQRWADAAAISNATGGRNVTLTVGQVVRNSQAGQDMPSLVVTWESGPDNDADVYAAVGFHRPDGSVLWSDAMNLLPGGVAETNHSIGISGDRLVVATEAQAIVDPVSIDLFREAAFNNTIGFYLADAITGAVVDARTGAFISGTPFDDQGNPSANYASTASANSIWKGTVRNGGTTTITQSFDVHASLNLDGMALLPFMEVDTGKKRHTFVAGSSGNSDRISHITMLGNNVFGFEDQLSGGDFDFDDMVAVIRSVNIL